MVTVRSTGKLALLEIARLQEEHGYLESALEIYERMLEAKPERKDLKEAVSRIRRSLVLAERRTGHRPPHPIQLIEKYALSGDHDTALELLDNLKKKRRDDPILKTLERSLHALASRTTSSRSTSTSKTRRASIQVPGLWVNPSRVRPDKAQTGPCGDDA